MCPAGSCRIVSPEAIIPASIMAAPARRSVLRTTPPHSGWPPSTSATLFSTRICPPRRHNSDTCIKRFSNTVSLSRLVPWHLSATTVIGACMSVGKPG